MSEESVKVSIPPEQIESLKEKYNLPEEALSDVMNSLRVSIPSSKSLPMPPAEDTESGEPKFMRQLMRGEIGLGEAVFYSDYIDRKEERRLQRERHNTPPPPPSAKEIGEHVGAYVSVALKDAGLTGKPVIGGKEEMPEWAKEIEKQQTEILGRLRGDEEAKKLEEAVAKGVDPVKRELERTQERVKELSKPSPEGVAPPKSAIDQYIEGRSKLKDAGILTEERKSNIMLGPDGNPIPIKGEIPAALVYGPYIVDQILGNIETRIHKIASKYGLGGSAPETAKKEELIKMPVKPPPKEPPALPTTEVPAKPILTLPEREEKPLIEEVTPPTEQPEKPVERPPVVTKTTEEQKEEEKVSPPVEEVAPPEKLCVKCESPVTEIKTDRGVRYRCPQCKKFTKIKEVEKSGESKATDH